MLKRELQQLPIEDFECDTCGPNQYNVGNV